MSGTVINLLTDLDNLNNISERLVKTLAEINLQEISEVVFAVGSSKQGWYLRIDLLPYPSTHVVESKKEVGVSCCGDFSTDNAALITLEVDYTVDGNKCNVSIQTGRSYAK